MALRNDFAKPPPPVAKPPRAPLQSPGSGALCERIASKIPAVLADGADNDVVG